MEYNGACVDKHRESMRPATIHVGDQGNVADLYRLINASGGGFDLVIDDGSHRWRHQQTSLDVLIHHGLAPGGVYIIEDLLTSGDSGFEEPFLKTTERLQKLYLQMMLEAFSTTPPLKEDRALLRVVKWFQCATGVCALKTYDEKDRLLGRPWPRG
jgi:hypothetical protein